MDIKTFGILEKYCEKEGLKMAVPIQTNEEWFCTATTEQLADALMKIFVARTFCHLCPEGDVCDIGYQCKYSEGKKIEDWTEWLKQPHENGE